MPEPTSRRLILMRHAKAENWAGSDHARKLAKRGCRDAAAVGRWLAASGLTPDVVVVSSAARAVQTGTCVCEGLDQSVSTIELDELYGADEQELIELCAAQIPSEARCALVIGHNPTIAMAVHLLQPESTRQDFDFPTAALAVFEVPDEWSSLQAGTLQPTATHVPK